MIESIFRSRGALSKAGVAERFVRSPLLTARMRVPMSLPRQNGISTQPLHSCPYREAARFLFRTNEMHSWNTNLGTKAVPDEALTCSQHV